VFQWVNGKTVRWKTRSTWKKTSSIANLSTTNPTWIYPAAINVTTARDTEGDYFLVLLSVITLYQWVTIFQLLKATSSPYIQGFISSRKILEILTDL
jgi:hypothetical protein